MSEDIRKMIDKVKNFKEFVNENLELKKFINLSENDIELIVNKHDEFDDYQFNNAKNALLYLQKFLKTNNILKLYRVLSVENINDINTNKLGNHYTLSLSNLDDVTLFDIGINKNNKLYSVEIISPIDNIDFQETIEANVNYPFEQEVFLKSNDNVKIINISPFENV
jgi:prenyltransferase beta subunit